MPASPAMHGHKHTPLVHAACALLVHDSCTPHVALALAFISHLVSDVLHLLLGLGAQRRAHPRNLLFVSVFEARSLFLGLCLGLLPRILVAPLERLHRSIVLVLNAQHLSTLGLHLFR